jgi:fatty-acyl-CoA synthase
MPHFPKYLWTLPMFHCNGWCFPWTVAMLGGTHVCLRKVEASAILDAIASTAPTTTAPRPSCTTC